MLREASAAGLALAAREVAAAADRHAALHHLRPAFALPLELAPRANLPASGWFVRDDEMYTFREVDAQHIRVLGPFPDIDRASALLAEVARGDHPDALDAARVRGAPSTRLASARARLEKAQARARRTTARAAASGG